MDANKRLATLLMNIIFCYFDKPSIVLLQNYQESLPGMPYYLVVQALIDDDLKPFQAFVTSRLHIHQRTGFYTGDPTLAKQTSLRMAIADRVQQIQTHATNIGAVIDIAPYFNTIATLLPPALQQEKLDPIKEIDKLEHFLSRFDKLFERINQKTSYEHPTTGAEFLALVQDAAPAEEPPVRFTM